MGPFGRSLSDGDRLEVAGAPVRLKVNRRARRVSLRLDRTKREVVATAPSLRRLPEAAAFAHERAGWIAERLAELPQARLLAPGELIEVFGRPVRLESGSGRARWVEPIDGSTPRIVAMGEGEGFTRAVILVIRRKATEVLTARTAHYAERLGAPMPKVTVADAKSRWGSCKPGPRGTPGQIRYSWRLALAPFEVADYVAAHECAHLRELNHGPRFWAHVRALVGDERRYRAWLRAEGARLHAIGK
ncbi:MAG: M48 family metallopeptidase [Caulobacterales bacterium]|nr:M48 family metallopeptidase [Caulobacterales bacterium]